MPQRILRRMATAIVAAGLVGGLAISGPTAWADPEVSPDPAVVDAPPVEQPAPPPVDPLAPPPIDPLAPPPVDPLALPPAAPVGAPTVIPEGTPAGQNPTPYVGQPVFAPPTFNPLNGPMVGVARPIYIN